MEIGRGCAAVHPRACGEQRHSGTSTPPPFGSSPRLRGTGIRYQPSRDEGRFIPAPAGNSMNTLAMIMSRTVHPRACGEQNCRPLKKCQDCGSSPRLRGTGVLCGAGAISLRFIPAPAGNRDQFGYSHVWLPVHPRACGEQLPFNPRAPVSPGSSPRLRGTDWPADPVGGCFRFIPAPAGNSPFLLPWRVELPVHPRACGEQFCPSISVCCWIGSSPRLRGTGLGHGVERLAHRFIPAPAGNSVDSLAIPCYASVHPRACGEQTNHYVIDLVRVVRCYDFYQPSTRPRRSP